MTKSEACALRDKGLIIEVFHDATLGIFDITELRRLLAALDQKYEPRWTTWSEIRARDTDTDDPTAWMLAQREIDEARVRELSAAQLEDPIIMVTHDDDVYLVDGAHRLAARRQRGYAGFHWWAVPLAAAPRIPEHVARAHDVPWGRMDVRDGRLVPRDE